METDAAIFTGFRSGRPGAAEELWRVFAPRMFAVARGLLGPKRSHMAGDIVQRVLMDVLRLPDSRLREVRDVGAFLVVSTRNATFNALRGEHREMTRLREVARRARQERCEGAADASSDATQTWAAFGDVARAMETLSEEHRDVLVLRHIAGLSFDQLSAALGVARSTLASRYAKAIEQLRERMTEKHVPSKVSADVVGVKQ